jgi:hypothetical protein
LQGQSLAEGFHVFSALAARPKRGENGRDTANIGATTCKSKEQQVRRNTNRKEHKPMRGVKRKMPGRRKVTEHTNFGTGQT